MYLHHTKEEDSCVSSGTLRPVIPPILLELAGRYMSTALDTPSGNDQLLFLISTHSGIRPKAAGGAFEIDRDVALVPGPRCVQPTCSHIVAATFANPCQLTLQSNQLAA